MLKLQRMNRLMLPTILMLLYLYPVISEYSFFFANQFRGNNYLLFASDRIVDIIICKKCL